MRLIASFASGLLFAIGLSVAGMTKPENVIGFLDFFGEWRAELLIVMGAAVVTLFTIKKLTGPLKRPLFEPAFRLPTRNDVNAPLLLGAALFGIGWGLVGLCPGPAILSLATLNTKLLYFVGAMAVGMTVHTKWERALERRN